MTPIAPPAMLDASFFSRPVLDVARSLIGKTIVRRHGRRTVTGTIIETEAYDGPDDRACHGRFGKTARTAPMFRPGGWFYVYLCYGMHWMLNIVTGEEGYPSAVLIRGILLPDGRRVRGPGRVTKALGITGALSGKPAVPGTELCSGAPAARRTGLWIEDRGIAVPRGAVVSLLRIGVEYAGTWARKPWRFAWEYRG